MAPPLSTRLLRDPGLIALTVVAVLVVGACLLDVGTSYGQLVACAIITPILDVFQFHLARRVCALPGLPRYAHRFWRAISVAGLFYLSGDLVQLATILNDPGLEENIAHPVQSLTLMAGMITICVAAMRPGDPAGRSRRDRLRMTLDTMIVSSASAVVAWALMSRPDTGSQGAGDHLLALFGCGVILCAAYAALRAALTGVAPASLAAAAPLAVSTVFLAASNILLPTGAVTDVGTQMALLLVPSFIVLAAPRIQVLQGRAGLEGQWLSLRTRQYGNLPYAGTVVCAATLVIVLATSGLGVSAWGALAGLLANVGMVIARQVLTLAENNSLIEEVQDRERRLTALLEQLRFQAGHDELTGLANRRQFTAAMAERSGDATVLLIDLNRFKQINDTYGHAAGDAMLRHVTGLLLECAGPGDLPARLGGDEFAVLAAGDAAAGEQIAARLRTALNRPARIAGRPIRPGASIGVASGPADDPDQLLHTADLRMYEEKQRSRAVV
ncbi:GGDEF domain-containing protein [Actinoplanes derwentensis]|uniref:Diguanylate cyclase (GGDEF) domain-containing protein n=1 Tax=Actinoplanes derwentensis TaxID=113562 RepID=A0A1H1PQN8_9ACTN|nr:GGDEF domain-containing protein [Actinoplanes derwentensis]GID88404.1 hypothetical protein Ade03nite_73280 [Actinoplanes derwentensis]SDS13621.1 diguanylate cyclase (GGDEF) domain-containing protein [Actinoplanes derwentensis]